MSPIFLGLHDVLGLHDEYIKRYGGNPGIRDLGLLESAIAMPSAGFGEDYLHRDIFEMAAAYLFHLVMNHPFIDGNKRTGAAAALLFLRINGKAIHLGNDGLVEMVLSVAKKESDKTAVAELFRNTWKKSMAGDL